MISSCVNLNSYRYKTLKEDLIYVLVIDPGIELWHWIQL